MDLLELLPSMLIYDRELARATTSASVPDDSESAAHAKRAST